MSSACPRAKDTCKKHQCSTWEQGQSQALAGGGPAAAKAGLSSATSSARWGSLGAGPAVAAAILGGGAGHTAANGGHRLSLGCAWKKATYRSRYCLAGAEPGVQKELRTQGDKAIRRSSAVFSVINVTLKLQAEELNSPLKI